MKEAEVDFAGLERTYEFDVFPKRPLTLVQGENARIWDDRGREYIDCVCGHGVANLGHAHPAIVAAVRSQAARLISLSNVFFNDQRALLVEKLARVTPPSLQRTFLCNSGAEAIEAAIKFARFTTGRTDFVCAMRGFHGRTLGALSATFKREYREAFEPLVPGFHFAPFNDFDRLSEKITDATAAVLLEPVQGEGGVFPGDPEYFRRVRRLCDERSVLLILDEIQTGFCRTGTFFACEQLGIEPDMLCLAKAIAGGLPMGAVVCSDKVQIPTGRHGTTFGGNPLSCAAANAAIDVMVEEDLAKQAREKGDYLVAKLESRPPAKVREIRHVGLMVGIELREKAVRSVLELLEHGVLTFPAGATVIRVYPPLTVEYELLDVIADKIRVVLE